MEKRRPLTALEKEVLLNMEDHRWVNEPLKSSFISGGLSEFRKYVINYNEGKIENHKKVESHEKIAVLLRGNDNKIILYKNNHKILALSARKESGRIICTVKFNYNHARYTEDWYEKLNQLREMGFRLGESQKSEYLSEEIMKKVTGNAERIIKVTRNKKRVNGGEIGTISCSKEVFKWDDVKKCLNIIQGLIEDFFKNQNKDFFRQAVSLKYPEACEISGSGSNVLVEKRWQQRLLFHFSDIQDGYYAYDLEFSQKYPDKAFVERFVKKKGDKYLAVTADSIKSALGTNEPDMLAIRYKNGKPQALVLIEVKSTESACKGNSGVIKHMEGMYEYVQQKDTFIHNRILDAAKCLSQYKEMGLLCSNREIGELPDDIQVEMVLLLTNANIPNDESVIVKNSAITFFENNKEKIKELSKQYNCKVWIANNDYWCKEICINYNPF